jgi:hypothetical protein
MQTRQVEEAVVAAQPIPIRAGLVEEYLGKDFLEAMQLMDLHTQTAGEEAQAVQAATEYQPALAELAV